MLYVPIHNWMHGADIIEYLWYVSIPLSPLRTSIWSYLSDDIWTEGLIYPYDLMLSGYMVPLVCDPQNIPLANQFPFLVGYPTSYVTLPWKSDTSGQRTVYFNEALMVSR